MGRKGLLALLFLTGSISGFGFDFDEPPPPQPAHGRWEGGPPPGAPMRRSMGGPGGRWWTNPDLVQKLGLTADQQKRIDDAFVLNRLKLIDLNAALQKEEALLEPMLEADHPDEGKVLQQIDRVAQARAELEKANARMLLGFRSVLTTDQWKKLQAERPQRHGGDGPPRPR